MKICVINHLYTPFIRGGAENVVKDIAEEFIRNGDEVVVITSKPRFWKKDIRDTNCKVYYLNSLFFYLDKIPSLIRFFWHFYNLFDVYTAFITRKILAEEKVDVVITNNLAGLSYLIPCAIRKTGVFHAHILHDIQLIHPSGLLIYKQEKKIHSFFAKCYQGITRSLFRNTEVVISPSNWLLNEHVKLNFFSSSRKMVLVNPLNIKKGNWAKERSSVFNVLYVAQLEEHKGVVFLINSFLELLKQNNYHNLVLTIIGSGSKVKFVEEKSDSLSIKYAGFKNRQEVLGIMGQSDLLVVPSLCYENSPTVIFEAIYQNLPILASDIGGIPEIINKYGGQLFAVGESDDFMEKLVFLIKNPQKLEDIKIKYSKSVDSIKKDGNYVEVINKVISDISRKHF